MKRGTVLLAKSLCWVTSRLPCQQPGTAGYQKSGGNTVFQAEVHVFCNVAASLAVQSGRTAPAQLPRESAVKVRFPPQQPSCSASIRKFFSLLKKLKAKVATFSLQGASQVTGVPLAPATLIHSLSVENLV